MAGLRLASWLWLGELSVASDQGTVVLISCVDRVRLLVVLIRTCLTRMRVQHACLIVNHMLLCVSVLVLLFYYRVKFFRCPISRANSFIRHSPVSSLAD